MQAARDAGLAFERRRYRPHVTLARFNAGPDAARRPSGCGPSPRAARGFRAGPFEVEEFVLMRSWLGRAGPVYDTLATYPLQPRRLEGCSVLS